MVNPKRNTYNLATIYGRDFGKNSGSNLRRITARQPVKTIRKKKLEKHLKGIAGRTWEISALAETMKGIQKKLREIPG